MADAVGVAISGGTAIQRPVDLLIGQLASKNVLLVVDNCEHLVEPVAVFVETVLARCPDVSVLATSREALAVSGEVQLPVAPLVVPPDDVPPARVAEFAASQLFLDRALAVVPDLSVHDDVLSAVGSGMPAAGRHSPSVGARGRAPAGIGAFGVGESAAGPVRGAEYREPKSRGSPADAEGHG